MIIKKLTIVGLMLSGELLQASSFLPKLRPSGLTALIAKKAHLNTIFVQPFSSKCTVTKLPFSRQLKQSDCASLVSGEAGMFRLRNQIVFFRKNKNLNDLHDALVLTKVLFSNTLTRKMYLTIVELWYKTIRFLKSEETRFSNPDYCDLYKKELQGVRRFLKEIETELSKQELSEQTYKDIYGNVAYHSTSEEEEAAQRLSLMAILYQE